MPYNQLGLISTSENVCGLTQLLKCLHFQVRAIWCPDQDIGIQVAAEHEVQFVASRPDEVLLRRDVEMVIIACAPHLHAQMCDKAMGIGKHVLCILPCALNKSDTSRILSASEYYPQLLAIAAFALRRHPTFIKTKHILKSEKCEIGLPLLIEIRINCAPLHSWVKYDWRWEIDNGGGILQIIGAHIIDLLAYLLDRRATKVNGITKTYGNKSPPSKALNGFRHLNSDDFCNFAMKFDDSDICATLNFNSINSAVAPTNSNFEMDMRITGSKGVLRIKNEQIFITECQNGKERKIFEHDNSKNSVDLNFTSTQIYCCDLMQEGFLETLRELSLAAPDLAGLKNLAGFDDVQYVRSVIDSVRKSSFSGKWIEIKDI